MKFVFITNTVGTIDIVAPLVQKLVGTCVAVDCIALNYWGKHKRKMVVRGIN